MNQKYTTNLTYQWNKKVENLAERAAKHLDRAFGIAEK